MSENFYGDIGYGVPDDMTVYTDNPAYATQADYSQAEGAPSIVGYDTGASPDSGSSFWSQLSGILNKLPMDKLLTAGLGTFGAINSSNAMSDAAKQSAATQQQNSLAQIAQMQKMYEQQRADFAPYQAIGEAGALRLAGRNVPSASRSELNRLMGRG